MPTHPGGRDRRGMSTASANDARQHLPTAGSTSQPGRAIPALSAEQLTQVLKLVKHADSVELKLSVPDADRRSAVTALGMDPLDAQIRQVVFFDTPDLALNRPWGCRPGQAGPAEAGRLRRQAPTGRTRRTSGRTTQIPRLLSRGRRHARRFRLLRVHEGRGNRCRPEGVARWAPAGPQGPPKDQRAFLSANAPDGVQLDGLAILGPITVLKLKFTPTDFGRRLVAELWAYPDGSRVLELSTKCAPAEAFTAAAETKAFLAGRGVDLFAEQQTKTRSALEYFARELETTAADE